MAAHLLPLLNASSRNFPLKPLSAFLHSPVKRYSKSRSGEHGVVGGRAPSTAEEFQRLAAEKRELRRSAEEKSQSTSHKVTDESVEEKYKEAGASADDSIRKGE